MSRLILLAICNVLLFTQFSGVTSFVSANPFPRNTLKSPRGVDKFTAASNGAPLVPPLTQTVAAEQQVSGGTASLSSSTFNLAKGIIGAGVFSLPSGVAFFSDQPAALLPASIICAVFGLIAAYSFSSIGKVCKDTNSKSFQEAWENTVDKKSAWLISGSITSMCFLASLAYIIIIGDSFSSLAQTFNLPEVLAKRSNIILLLSALVLFPLSSLKSLSALSPFSLLGLGGTLYTAIFMAIRYMDQSYFKGGQFFEAIAATSRPSFNKRGPYVLNHLTFVLLSMLSTSYIAHFNAPRFYNELQNNTMARFNTLVGGAFGSAILFFIFVMGIGFLSFGGNTQGFVLNNYASSDTLATFARFAIGLALVTSFPFTFSALRDGVMDIMNKKGEERNKSFGPLTLVLLSLVTGLALSLNDVGFVNSITGALFGCLLLFVVPGVMNLKNRVSPLGAVERLGNVGMIAAGVVMGVLGVYVSVARQLGHM